MPSDLQVTNIKANDGTAGLVIADSTGSVTGTFNGTVGPSASGHGLVSDYSVWLITTTFGLTNGDLDSNWSEIPTALADGSVTGYQRIGGAMTQSSGVFTFPSTGLWVVRGFFTCRGNSSTPQVQGIINTTVNNSSYNVVAKRQQYCASDPGYQSMDVTYLFDVTDTANRKVKFSVIGTTNSYWVCDTYQLMNGASFTKIGST